MARRTIEVISPAPSKLNIQGSSAKMSSGSSGALFFFLGAVVLFAILIILIFIFWKYIKPSEIRKFIFPTSRRKASKDLFSGNIPTVSYFDFQTLKKATKNFHPSNLLGRGGFGPVYRGKLADERLVAVKKLSLEKSQQGESEFLSEAWKLYERSRVIDLVDPRMREDGIVEKDVLRAINVAFLCLQPHANLRPPMSDIVAMLTCKTGMAGTPMKPAFLDRRRKKVEMLSWDTISESFSFSYAK
ncbi:hypothetical protein Patl1_14082 [Pistacia atlantica]|uniref:Uncharacterized protein n=1 Tax=Pistacia atlantica TaxID=434234 RepID=A0ACC1AWE7_9ROSI|nr:hypothetical protein Patl1_14082 [Pistacia atlantica]